MADTQARIFVTSAAWVSIASGEVTTGTISPETQDVRVAISTTGAPADLTQGHVLNGGEGWGFILDDGETLWAIATRITTSVIVTY